jgi:hypothetical protein
VSPSLYGREDGTWALLEVPPGIIPPTALTVGTPGTGTYQPLRYLGDPSSAITRVYIVLSARGRQGRRTRPAQTALAKMLGVTQQSVSRYICGIGGSMVLSDGGWAALVRVWHNPSLVIPQEQETPDDAERHG